MLRVGVGRSSHFSADPAAEEAAIKAMAAAGLDRADWAFVFCTVDHLSTPSKFLPILARVTGTDQMVGSSGAGILTGEGEIEGASGMAVMVFSSDRIRAHPFLFQPLRERDQDVAGEIARVIGTDPGRESLAVIFPDAYNSRPNRILQAVETKMGFLPIVGAGSSENGDRGATFQLFGDQVATNAVAGVVLTGSFDVAIDMTQGCQPITEPMTITQAQGNVIFEIDSRPAFEVFAKVIKGPLLDDLRRALAVVFVGLPSDSQRNSVGPGEYLVRNILGFDPQKGILAVGEEVGAGQHLIFALRDAQRARGDLTQMLQRRVANLGGRSPQMGLYFNCCARGTSLYGISDIDTAYIRSSLGDFPLIGFFGNYELAPLGHANRLLAYTGVLALITERDWVV